jgi:phosphoenolpyruvate carboxylase
MTENIKAFENLVLLKYQVFNSVFLTLELDGVHKTGILLPLLSEHCEKEFKKGKNPREIIEGFFSEHRDFTSKKEQLNQLFRFIQYIERQVVLVDALEDASFSKVNNLDGPGSFKALYESCTIQNRTEALLTALEKFRVRLVLTAHPTQFYPGAVLGIITDLTEAIESNNLIRIRELLAQLGKTPFFKKEKPTPFEEAVSLTWYLENIFYHSIPKLYQEVSVQLGQDAEDILGTNTLIQLGFWPGGDRDGNPFVSSETTLQVAERLRSTLMRAYYKDIRALRRKITFRGAASKVEEIERKLYLASFVKPENPPMKPGWIKNRLNELKDLLIEEHNSLYLSEVEDLIVKVKIFGFHFGSLDIRQDSRVINKAFSQVTALNKKNNKKNFEKLFQVKPVKHPQKLKDPVLDDVIQSAAAIREIQAQNGEKGCYRFIISNCRSEMDVARVFAIGKYVGLGEKMALDVIPLFETVDDLEGAAEVMNTLYSNPDYFDHLKNRHRKQVVMLGFSDGTKDGGYLTANWSIFKAKEQITEISRKHGIRVVFFDGRGGPPARGGGNTHKFYASLGPTIESSQIQITIQGQTISSNFGTVDSSRFNMEQLLSAGLENGVLIHEDKKLSETERSLIEEMSELSYKTYQDFKAHPKFVPFLEKMSTLKYYGQTNIGSRPSKRGKSKELNFDDLRAIPFVGAWSQLKLNIPGFFGLGTVFRKFQKEGRLEEISQLYNNSLFFRTLIENSMQSLSKSFFSLTKYMEKDEEFGDFWKLIFNEYKAVSELILVVSGQSELLQTNPSIKASIKLRESIVLPLLTIQQYALSRIRDIEKDGKKSDKDLDTLRKLVVRSLYGNINASRNSA